jgi:hypothetical protein
MTTDGAVVVVAPNPLIPREGAHQPLVAAKRGL